MATPSRRCISNQIAFGAVNLPDRANTDVFLAKLHGSDGSVVWAVSVATSGQDTLRGIAVDDAGHVVITGSVGAPFDGGGSPATPDAYVASYDTSNGALRWHKAIATAGDDTGTAVAFGRNGDLYAVISLGGSFDFGVPVIGAAGPTTVALRFVP